MSATSKKTSRSTKKGAKGAKMLISAAALAATFGGWVAMANDGTALRAGTGALPLQAQIVSASQASTLDAVSASAQPPAPVAVTRSSR